MRSPWVWLLLFVAGGGAYLLTHTPVTFVFDPRWAGCACLALSLIVARRARARRRLLIGLSVAGLLAYAAVTWLPYSEEEVRIASGDVELAGTLFVPRGDGPHPAVVFVQGVGRVPRQPYWVFANALARRGYVALIYDKRGAGESTGTLRGARYEDLADDVGAAIAFLRARPEVDATRVGIWGYSEGARTALLAASRTPGVEFLVLVAGGAVTPAQQQAFAVANRVKSAGYGTDQAAAAAATLSVIARHVTGRVDRALLTEKLGAARAQDWFAASGLPADAEAVDALAGLERQFDFDPQALARRLDVPMLYVYGARDTVVPARESAAAVKGATVRVIENATHPLAWQVGDSLTLPLFAPGYPAVAVDWIVAR